MVLKPLISEQQFERIFELSEQKSEVPYRRPWKMGFNELIDTLEQILLEMGVSEDATLDFVRRDQVSTRKKEYEIAF